jgi:hypothetical protein
MGLGVRGGCWEPEMLKIQRREAAELLAGIMTCAVFLLWDASKCWKRAVKHLSREREREREGEISEP